MSTKANLVANIICGVVAVILFILTIFFLIVGPWFVSIATGMLSVIFGLMVYFGLRSNKEKDKT